MLQINDVLLVGHAGGEPEVRARENGERMAWFSLATNTGGEAGKTMWHRIVVFGNQAGFVADHVGAGREVMVRGRIEYRKFVDQQTKLERKETNIVVGGPGSLVNVFGGARTPAGEPASAPAAAAGEPV